MKPIRYIFIILSLLAFSGSAGAQPKFPTVADMMHLLEDEYDIRFVYESGLDISVVYVGTKPDSGDIDKDLDKVFRGSGISWRRNGRYVVLTKAAPKNINIGEDGEMQDTISASRITADRFMRTRTQTGLKAIDGSRFNQGYAALSSPDLIKTLQSYTGVSSGTEMLAGLYVHGGTGRDNLFLLDGVPLYQVSHLAGLFSSFNTDMIDNVDFYKSGFPARFGGRLSSVVDVSLRDGDYEDYHGSFSIGLLDGRFQYEGPIVRGKTSFNVSLRRSWIDLLAYPVVGLMNIFTDSRYNISYRFHDLNAKITHRFADGNKLTFNVFSGLDALRFRMSYPKNVCVDEETDSWHGGESGNDIRMKWGNFLTSLNYSSRINDELRYKAILYYTRTRSKVRFEDFMHSWDSVTKEFSSATMNDSFVAVNDASAKADFVWTPHENHVVRFGGQYLFHVYKPERVYSKAFKAEVGESYSDAEDYETRYIAHEPSLYIEDEMRLLRWFDLTLGLRYAMFAVDGKLWNGLEPRVSANVRFSENMALKASYVEMNQYTHGITTTSVDLPTNCWLPATGRVRPMHSRQFAAEFMMNLPRDVHIELGGYYRTLDNIYEYSGMNLFFPNIMDWEHDFVEGQGLAYGAEAAVGWSGRKVDVNAYYTLSWSKRKFDDFYYDWYCDRNDSRHKLTLDFAYRINDRVDLYASWNYHTGLWATCCSNYLEPEDQVWRDPNTFYTGPNNLQLPDYHRLDLGANFRKTTKKGREAVWNVSVYNAYCRMNALFITDWSADADGGNPRLKTASVFPIIPSFSYTLKF